MGFCSVITLKSFLFLFLWIRNHAFNGDPDVATIKRILEI